MGKTNIAWTDLTWNLLAGCTHLSPGCKHCYAAEMTQRLARFAAKKRADGERPGKLGMYEGVLSPLGRFNGVVNRYQEALREPLHVRRPSKIFVNSMSDLFHAAVPFEFVDQVFAVMALRRRHTYQILTKRPERLAEYLLSAARVEQIKATLVGMQWGGGFSLHANGEAVMRCIEFLSAHWPLPNVWLGTSIERQDYMGRVEHLLRCPAAVRFLSGEPLLGPLDFDQVFDHHSDCAVRHGRGACDCDGGTGDKYPGGIDQVIFGGESGPHRRDMQIPWLLDGVAQCQAAGVAVFVKQDTAAQPGQQGRIPNDVWALKQFPRVAS